MARQTEMTGKNTPQAIEAALGHSANGERTGLFREIEEMLGVLPGFFKMMPPTHLQAEWHIFKAFELSPGTALDPKVKELIGLAVAAQMQCKYCTHFHTVAAGIHGATPEEIDEAILMAKHTAGWSTFLAGASYDFEQLQREVDMMRRHLAQSGAGHRA